MHSCLSALQKVQSFPDAFDNNKNAAGGDTSELTLPSPYSTPPPENPIYSIENNNNNNRRKKSVGRYTPTDYHPVYGGIGANNGGISLDLSSSPPADATNPHVSGGGGGHIYPSLPSTPIYDEPVIMSNSSDIGVRNHFKFRPSDYHPEYAGLQNNASMTMNQVQQIPESYRGKSHV